MDTRTKQITLYVANDGTEFISENECILYEKHIRLDMLHKNLIACNFHSRCKIQPYFHNNSISFIGHKNISADLTSNNSYVLMRGRIGNGDDMVRYKLRGSTIVMLKYSTDDGKNDTQKFLCSIPSKWLDLTVEDLQIEVDEFIANRKVFKRVVTSTYVVTYEEN